MKIGIPNKLYVIVNTKTNTLWVTPGGKLAWNAKGHAKNAWNSGYYQKDISPTGEYKGLKSVKWSLDADRLGFKVVEVSEIEGEYV